MTKEKPVAIEVVKEARTDEADDIFECDGVRVKINSVPSNLIQDALARLEPPEVPRFFNEDKAREEENPNHPGYLAAMEKYQEKRGAVSVEVMIMAGAELLDGLPENDKWLKELKLLHKRGTLDLTWVDDWDDPFIQEFLFKKYKLTQTNIITAIGRRTGVSQEGIDRAKRGFRRNS